MNEFVHTVLTELKNNPTLKSEPLVNVVVDSTEKSIALGESEVSIYNKLKNGLAAINESSVNPNIEAILLQFSKNEDTLDSKIAKIASKSKLSNKVLAIKESSVYSDPIAKTQIDLFESTLLNGSPEFSLCGHFINTFEKYSYEPVVASQLKSVKVYLNENQSELKILGVIYQMDSLNSSIYSQVSENLKNMLISESYSADILKIKYGTSIPLITGLINDLRIDESKKYGTFTIGEGNSDTVVNNLITPATTINNGMLLFADNRFISIRESNEQLGHETVIHIDETFKIAELNPEYVKTNHGKFYEFCEAYATLGFAKSNDGTGVETNSIRNFKLGFKTNENKSLDLYVNGTKLDESTHLNISESLVFQNSAVKEKINKIVNNTNLLFNFEFIKEVTNDRTLSEALIVNLNENYFVCNKVNAADRQWMKVDEHQLSNFLNSKFNYDVTSIFKVKIDESIENIKNIETNKSQILENIQKLESTLPKLNTALSSSDMSSDDSNKLTSIKESIESTIAQLKNEYERIDLLKKNLV
jgi:hypothetical protein